MTVLATDFHTHILPCIDDGSSSIQDSIEMLRMEYEQGVKTVFLTPHFNALEMYPETFLKNRSEAMEKLREALAGEHNIPKLIAGAEVGFCSGMHQWDELRNLTLGNTGYILIEMPTTEWTIGMYEELEMIYRERNITPVLAHVERYLTPLKKYSTLRRLYHLPVLLQSNCGFINSKRTRRTALKLLTENRVHLIGSDCHDLSSRPPCMSKTRDILNARASADTLSFLRKTEHVVLRGGRMFFDRPITRKY